MVTFLVSFDAKYIFDHLLEHWFCLLSNSLSQRLAVVLVIFFGVIIKLLAIFAMLRVVQVILVVMLKCDLFVMIVKRPFFL